MPKIDPWTHLLLFLHACGKRVHRVITHGVVYRGGLNPNEMGLYRQSKLLIIIFMLQIDGHKYSYDLDTSLPLIKPRPHLFYYLKTHLQLHNV